MRFAFILVLALAVFLISCSSEAVDETSGQTDSFATEMPGEEDVQNDEIQEYGLIKRIEDAGYPFFIVTVEFSERNMTIDFNLNAEEASLAPDVLQSAEGKYATIYYTSNLEPSLVDMTLNGKSVMLDEPLTRHPDYKVITGVLTGAEEPTPGDLPDEVCITDKNGEQQCFKYYVDDEMVRANGQEVVAIYTLQGRNNITRLQLSGN